MNAARLAAAALLTAAAYVLWRDSSIAAQSPGGYRFDEVLDTVGEAVTAATGIEFRSARYVGALNDPKNAEIIAMLSAAEDRNGIPSGLLVRQAWQESRLNPAAVNKASGAKGLMQFMDATAAEWGVDQFNAQSSADGAGRYMAWLYGRVGSWPMALAAYNWGVGNVMRKGMGAAPLETRNYVAEIGADAGLA